MKSKPQQRRDYRLLRLGNADISRNQKRFLSYHCTARIWFGLAIKKKLKGRIELLNLNMKPFVMMMQTVKYWITDNLSLLFTGYTHVENNPFSFLSFSR